MTLLRGKNLLITGAGRGLGRAIALAFAAEGANVALSFSQSAAGADQSVREAKAHGVLALARRAELTDRAQIEALITEALRAFGRLDVLINNAGRFSSKPLSETSDEVWDTLLAINLTAPFLITRAVAASMLTTGGGSIINLASGGGLHPRPGYDTSPAYAASKAGLIMLTKKLALELAPTIRVNCIAPGIVDSKPQPMPEPTRARFSAITPLRRIGRPDDIAAAAVYLASDQASFITGQILNVDGGIVM
jgi:3-oxoacyl-[acyl-carrier protein] reductase